MKSSLAAGGRRNPIHMSTSAAGAVTTAVQQLMHDSHGVLLVHAARHGPLVQTVTTDPRYNATRS
jgi:hypothetical protein